jgi:hypothetical protein
MSRLQRRRCCHRSQRSHSPTKTAEKLYYGTTLTLEEQEMVERAPDITQQLVGHIPRLEPVRDILKARAEPLP